AMPPVLFGDSVPGRRRWQNPVLLLMLARRQGGDDEGYRTRHDLPGTGLRGGHPRRARIEPSRLRNGPEGGRLGGRSVVPGNHVRTAADAVLLDVARGVVALLL